MFTKKFFSTIVNDKLLIIILFLLSILVNQYYGNKGVFPVDSFSHFDTGYRILLGEFPFKDYWIVSGPLVDYLQAIFFYLFGVNWQSYLIHASLINGVLTVGTFLLLRNFQLNIFYSFAYSFFLSILAYPSSGTPFVDHHSAFFSLLGIYILIFAIKTEKKIYWILLPIFFILAFLSKQTPASYIIISSVLILSSYSILKKNFDWIKYSLASSILFIFIILIIGKNHGITFSSFLQQYIFYPLTIGNERFENINVTFQNIIAHFKFIYLSMVILFYVNFKRFFYEKNFIRKNDFFYFLCLLLLTFSLIFHQLLTQNQTFIFFLIPILIAFSQISLNIYKFNSKKILHIIMILACLFATTKYHIRFNEERKFHELNYVNFELAFNGKKIDKKLLGLKWITPNFEKEPKEEIILINKTKSFLKNDNRNKMVMTNYSIFSSILEQKLYSPSRWYLYDGTDYPIKGNEFFVKYKDFLINLIKKNKINVIYTINLPSSSVIYDYIDMNCFEVKEINEILIGYEIKNCKEINN